MSGSEHPDTPSLPTRGVAAWFPGIWVLRHYQRQWFARDLAAGLVLTALLVPAGMGYAEAAGLPAVTGLYATVIPILVYAVFGPSRVLVLGPDSALAAMIAAAVASGAAGDPARALGLASVLAMLMGGFCLLAGLIKVGFITDLLSKPVRVGYTNGIALTIVVTQTPKLFGLSVSGTSVVDAFVGFFGGVHAGLVNQTALVIGASCLAVILLLKFLVPRVPGILVAVVGATIVVSVLGLADHVRVLGVVPRGLPSPTLPALGLAEMTQLIAPAMGLAVVAFADTVVLSRSLAARRGDRFDPNAELVALGVANAAAGVFGGFPVSASSSRTPVAEVAGARTQVTGIVSAVLILLLLVFAPALLRNLPLAALAAVVLAAAFQLFNFRELGVFFRVRRSDFFVCVVAFVSVLLFGVLSGIAAAVIVSLLDFIRRAWRPHDAILGRARGVKGYHDIGRYPGARQIPGLVIFRWDAPLFFANAQTFRERVLEVAQATTPHNKWVVIAAEPITDVDTTAAEMIEDLDAALGKLGVELVFAELKDPVKDRLDKYGVQERIGRDFFFPTIGVAVKAYVQHTGVTWTDWEDESDSERG